MRYTEDKATVILVTDGIETCDADPCALANQLEQSGIDFTAHVVGFGLSDEEGRQVACLADNTGGHYLPAANADELADALGRTVAIAPKASEPVKPVQKKPKHNLLAQLSLIEGGEPLPKEATNGLAWYIQPMDSQGTLGKKRNISRSHKVKWSGPTGQYLVSIEYRLGGHVNKPIKLDEFVSTNETIALNAARLSGVGAFMQEEFGISDANLRWSIRHVETKKQTTLYGQSLDIVVPAGSYDIAFGLRGEKPKDNPPRRIEVSAGEEKQIDFILPISEIEITALEADKSRNTKIRQRFQRLREDGTAGQTVKYEASAKKVYLRPGKYLASIEIWDGTKRKPVEMPINVGLGQTHAFSVQLQ